MVASFVSSYFFCTPNMGLTLYISVAHLIGHSDRFLHVSWFYLDNIPDRINPRPSWFGIGSIRFAFVVRLEPQDPSTRFEGARACTVGTFHERNATVQKTREINGNHPRKRACGGFGGLRLRRLDSAPGCRLGSPRSSLIHLLCGCRSRFLRPGIREETCSASVPLACSCPVNSDGGASRLGPAPSLIQSVLRRSTSSSAAFSDTR